MGVFEFGALQAGHQVRVPPPQPGPDMPVTGLMRDDLVEVGCREVSARLRDGR